MDIDGASITSVIVAPDVVQELITREDGSTIAYEIGEQFELFGLQFQVLPTTVDTPARQVDTEWTGNQLTTGRAYLLSSFLSSTVLFAWRIVRAAQERSYACQQLSATKGLGHVVISSHFQTNHLIDLIIFGSEHHNRRRGRATLSTQLTTDLQTIHTWEHDIQNNQIRNLTPCRIQCAAAISRRHDAIACLLQIIGNGLHQNCLIVHHQDFASHDSLLHINRNVR